MNIHDSDTRACLRLWQLIDQEVVHLIINNIDAEIHSGRVIEVFRDLKFVRQWAKRSGEPDLKALVETTIERCWRVKNSLRMADAAFHQDKQ